ncbi:SubName: Full=Related to YEA4-uridine diphosphate-N-acetylglucosamine transporter {ECO:0000313/EMBL:CCA67001.1} [Serendipita indica DSM 11827]|uniref:Related to YEA4-uridine diphosphate-N-acetylglucosamine transporter n=1 Tax=Serendipita indica (strain DSM 11827) TaxID=1109443 RepID=G4T6P5_SERID|nr:SubName: Full=Related to YEA4-uridine diphosphate-N-acetylglucosamine transporter {ECO:0000313/EMBL:CCA67001.1} [Serendipita indica DSM 11827]CCA67001.1 related to YEA4-uridine diphosphate-N-acetylglucosamine transporter [Serendipita indica DSM 11827]
MSLSASVDWAVILSLIFGGCCSNAWALEKSAAQNRNAGTLITLAQFVIVTLVGLPKHLCFKTRDTTTSYSSFSVRHLLSSPSSVLKIRLKPRAIPISRWMVQVILFLLTSLLNNAAFKYRVPMTVHIIFRSAGLVTNLLLGWAWAGKRYTRLQVLSVLLVTLGVALTTISTRPRTSPTTSSIQDEHIQRDYAIGVSILTGALILSSAMGLSQDKTYSQYGRGHWEEGMFYLHFLSLPMFAPLLPDIQEQVQILNASPPLDVLGYMPREFKRFSAPSIPIFWVPVIINVVTQLVCVSGVHRLTAKVSSLTVTLVTAVRKAVSLVLSVVVFGGGRGDGWLWMGSSLVFIGTLLYTADGTRRVPESSKSKGLKQE